MPLGPYRDDIADLVNHGSTANDISHLLLEKYKLSVNKSTLNRYIVSKALRPKTHCPKMSKTLFWIFLIGYVQKRSFKSSENLGYQPELSVHIESVLEFNSVQIAQLIEHAGVSSLML